MNTKDIRNALKSRLSGGVSWPTGAAWPNIEYSGARPYFDVTMTLIERQGGTIKGDEVLREIGQMSVAIVVEHGGGEDAALDYADAVAALFPEGHKIAITGGKITIPRPAEIRGGYPTDTDYRVPVVIRYHADRNF